MRRLLGCLLRVDFCDRPTKVLRYYDVPRGVLRRGNQGRCWEYQRPRQIPRHEIQPVGGTTTDLLPHRPCCHTRSCATNYYIYVCNHADVSTQRNQANGWLLYTLFTRKTYIYMTHKRIICEYAIYSSIYLPSYHLSTILSSIYHLPFIFIYLPIYRIRYPNCARFLKRGEQERAVEMIRGREEVVWKEGSVHGVYAWR
jgi:hypothetical protein